MKWKLTQQAIGQAEIDMWDDDEDLTLGFSLMRALSEEFGLREIGPGLWSSNSASTTWVPKIDLGEE